MAVDIFTLVTDHCLLVHVLAFALGGFVMLLARRAKFRISREQFFAHITGAALVAVLVQMPSQAETLPSAGEEGPARAATLGVAIAEPAPDR